METPKSCQMTEAVTERQKICPFSGRKIGHCPQSTKIGHHDGGHGGMAACGAPIYSASTNQSCMLLGRKVGTVTSNKDEGDVVANKVNGEETSSIMTKSDSSLGKGMCVSGVDSSFPKDGELRAKLRRMRWLSGATHALAVALFVPLMYDTQRNTVVLRGFLWFILVSGAVQQYYYSLSPVHRVDFRAHNRDLKRTQTFFWIVILVGFGGQLVVRFLHGTYFADWVTLTEPHHPKVNKWYDPHSVAAMTVTVMGLGKVLLFWSGIVPAKFRRVVALWLGWLICAFWVIVFPTGIVMLFWVQDRTTMVGPRPVVAAFIPFLFFNWWWLIYAAVVQKDKHLHQIILICFFSVAANIAGGKVSGAPVYAMLDTDFPTSHLPGQGPWWFDYSTTVMENIGSLFNWVWIPVNLLYNSGTLDKWSSFYLMHYHLAVILLQTFLGQRMA